MRYWLMKTEPSTFSIDDLKSRPDQTDAWNGVRNYQARNMMRDEMKRGDKVFIYHSSCAEPGIVGIARIVREAYPDPSAFDPRHAYYDPKSKPDAPRWLMVDVKFERKFRRTLSLTELKERADALDDFVLLRRGNRLSVMPVTETQWTTILGFL
ncbi:MAG: EVE domain-containing protein [Pseudomonadales bacterium]